MEEIILQAQKREAIGKGKVKNLRQEGFIPGIVYGQDKDALAVKVMHSEFLRLVHQHRIEGIVINLKIKERGLNTINLTTCLSILKYAV